MDRHVRLVICHGRVRPKQLYISSHYVTTVESRGTTLTNVVKLRHMLMMWLLLEEDCKILWKYLHYWSNKQIRWGNK